MKCHDSVENCSEYSDLGDCVVCEIDHILSETNVLNALWEVILKTVLFVSFMIVKPIVKLFLLPVLPVTETSE